MNGYERRNSSDTPLICYLRLLIENFFPIRSLDKTWKLAYDNYENDNQFQIRVRCNRRMPEKRKEACLMPLSMVERGESREITDFRGQEELKRHLQDLGFVRGEEIRVLGDNPGGMILMVKGVKVALNRALANRILVAD